MWFTKSRRAQNDQDYETWITGGVSPTLNAFDNAHETRATVVIAFDEYNQSVTENVYRALRIGINLGDCIAIPIQDGREMDKKQNGLGIGSEGDPSYTLDQTGAQAVAYGICDDETVSMNIMPTMPTPSASGGGHPPAVAYSIREDAVANNFSATEITTARSLSALRPFVQSHHAQTFITEPTMQVRRLTPIKCERLMGWPDNHTATGTNGPVSDTNRYKMCGNGVASPVAQWIGEAIMACHPTTSFMDIYLDTLEAERRSDAEQ